MRYINTIYKASIGQKYDNATVLPVLEECVRALPLDEAERKKLCDFVRFQLVGERSRRSVVPAWRKLSDFEGRAKAFEAGAEEALDDLAAQIAPEAGAAGVTFDAVFTTTSTGSIMPGLSYRLAHRLGGLVRPDTLMADLAHVGCTGSIKALNLARALDDSFRNILVVSCEVPSTLLDTTGTGLDLWQGNCTFGDGAAALRISSEPDGGDSALAIEQIHYRQRSDTGLDLIRWGYRNYYTFALADQQTFDRDVRDIVVETLGETEAGWKDEPRWAIHPAGILLLMRISRKLGIPVEAIKPSVEHYRENSNMSSASILHILKDVAETTPVGSAINLLTMGAGFNVIYGRVRRVR